MTSHATQMRKRAGPLPIFGQTRGGSTLQRWSYDTFFLLAHQPPGGHGLLIHEVSRSHFAPHSVWLLWSSDQLVAETSTWQHTTLTTDRHATDGIRTHNPSKRAAADPRLKVPIHVRVWLASPAGLGFQWVILVRVWSVTSLTLADYI
jgi:hypothetical protein